MDTLTSIRVFREVVDGGSFVAAAGRLGLSTAMTSKHVAHLERLLGARLLNRSSRHLSLTDVGRVYYEQSREALDILQSAEAAVGQQAQAPSGVLRVTAPVWIATQGFADMLAAYRRRYPNVVVEMTLENRRVDLTEEGYDIALRATSEPSPTLIARPLGRVRFVLVGSPAYLDEHGQPKAPADIESHDVILPTYLDMSSVVIESPAGRVMVRHRAAFRCSDSTLSRQAARAGMGLVYLPHWQLADDLASGALEQVLTDCRLFAPTLYAAYTSRKYMAPKVRTFIDFIAEAMQQGPLEPP
ncbi:MAG: LysR family transcriptional regulator [Rhodocyclaceae bacterium]